MKTNMRIGHRALLVAIIAAVSAHAFADGRFATLSSFPTMSVADSRSTITITATVRDSNGKPLDNVDVLFTTTLGSFRDETVKAIQGVARAVLVAGPVAGIAKITATPLGGAPASMDYEFVGSRAELSSARDYIEIVAPKRMEFAASTRVIAISGPSQSAYVKYRDVEVWADDVQLGATTYELKARRARLKIGKITREYEELNLTLNQHHGFGTTVRPVRYGEMPVWIGCGLAMLSPDSTGKYVLPPEQERFGLVEIFRDHIEVPRHAIPADAFKFRDDMTDSPSTVAAEKAVVFPRRGIQFQRAEIFVANARVVKMPLYELNFAQVSSPMITESLLNINDNQLALNYPHYLSLQPESSSLLRFHTGDQMGRTSGTSSGAFLDYELNWNRGDDMDGNLTVSGLMRNDWGVSARHFMRLDEHTQASFLVDTPQHNSILGNGSLQRQFTGFSANVRSDIGRSFQGLRSDTEDYSFSLDKDPMKVGKLPLRLFMNLQASSNRTVYYTPVTQSNGQTTDVIQRFSREGIGTSLQAVSNSLVLGPHTNMTASAKASQLYDHSTGNTLGFYSTLNLAQQLNRTMSLVGTYDYMHDNYSDALGNHRLSVQANLDTDKTSIHFFAQQTIDKLIDPKYVGNSHTSFFADASYHLNQKLRLIYNYTFDRTYLLSSTSFLDYTYGLGYRLGWKEVGLSWSNRTRRIGFQLLGSNF